MKKSNWGRWGDDDEIGALNQNGPAEVLAAAALIKEGRVISLAQPLSLETPAPAFRGRIQHFMARDGGDYAAGARRPGGFQFADDSIVMPLHVGTHIDALCHVWHDGKLYGGFDADTLRSGGAKHCGVEKLPPMTARGVLLDFVALSGGPLADGEEIGAERLAEALAAADTHLRAGDVVLLRTGWLERHEGAEHADFNAEPGLNVEGAEWLVEAGVSVIGADNFAIEAIPFPPGAVFPVHQRLLTDYGVPLIEGMALKHLAQATRATFAFVAAPLPIIGATASPLTPLAIL